VAGGDGTLEIADSGTIYRYSGNFLLRTRPLWFAQGGIETSELWIVPSVAIPGTEVSIRPGTIVTALKSTT
jgi:hypothetical protein